MPEPTATAAGLAAAATGTATGIAMGAMWPDPDIALLSGVICGSLVFLLRSTEAVGWKRAVYFLVSLVGGYYLAPSITSSFAWMPIWLSAFATSAALVVSAAIALDILQARLAQLLNRWVDRAMEARPVQAIMDLFGHSTGEKK